MKSSNSLPTNGSKTTRPKSSSSGKQLKTYSGAPSAESSNLQQQSTTKKSNASKNHKLRHGAAATFSSPKYKSPLLKRKQHQMRLTEKPNYNAHVTKYHEKRNQNAAGTFGKSFSSRVPLWASPSHLQERSRLESSDLKMYSSFTKSGEFDESNLMGGFREYKSLHERRKERQKRRSLNGLPDRYGRNQRQHATETENGVAAAVSGRGRDTEHDEDQDSSILSDAEAMDSSRRYHHHHHKSPYNNEASAALPNMNTDSPLNSARRSRPVSASRTNGHRNASRRRSATTTTTTTDIRSPRLYRAAPPSHVMGGPPQTNDDYSSNQFNQSTFTPVGHSRRPQSARVGHSARRHLPLPGGQHAPAAPPLQLRRRPQSASTHGTNSPNTLSYSPPSMAPQQRQRQQQQQQQDSFSSPFFPTEVKVSSRLEHSLLHRNETAEESEQQTSSSGGGRQQQQQPHHRASIASSTVSNRFATPLRHMSSASKHFDMPNSSPSMRVSTMEKIQQSTPLSRRKRPYSASVLHARTGDSARRASTAAYGSSNNSSNVTSTPGQKALSRRRPMSASVTKGGTGSGSNIDFRRRGSYHSVVGNGSNNSMIRTMGFSRGQTPRGERHQRQNGGDDEVEANDARR